MELDDPQLEEWAVEAPEEEVRTAMVHYSFLVQSYVWGEDTPPPHLPANLARPIVAIADRLGQAPLLPYSGYVLDNWYRLGNTPSDIEAWLPGTEVELGELVITDGIGTPSGFR